MAWASRLRRLVRNPLIVKDGLSRMRSWRAPAIMALYLGSIGLFAGLVLAAELRTSQQMWGLAQAGKTVFTALAIVQLALVCLFAPGVAAGAISGERERQTLDVLLLSSVTPFGIVWGKLVASVAFVLLLIVVGLPVFAIVFLFGGVDLPQFLVTQLLTVMTALAISAASIFVSAVFRRTLVSTVFAYGLSFAGTAGTAAVGLLLAYVFAPQAPNGPNAPNASNAAASSLQPLLMVNPISAMLSALHWSGQSPDFMPFRRTMQMFMLAPGPTIGGGRRLEAWQVTTAAELIVVVLSVLGAVLLLRGRLPFGLRLPRSKQVHEDGVRGGIDAGEATTLR